MANSKKILLLHSSILGEHSKSIALANGIVQKIQEKYPNSLDTEVDLVRSIYRI